MEFRRKFRPQRGRRIEKLDPYRQHEGRLDELPWPLDREAQSRTHYLISKWRAEGRPITGWRHALATGIAVDLTLHPRDLNWSRRMNGAKGGKASAISPRHFPIEKARLIRARRVKTRRLRKQYEKAKASNPFALPPGKRSGY